MEHFLGFGGLVCFFGNESKHFVCLKWKVRGGGGNRRKKNDNNEGGGEEERVWDIS
jgi:hypothetical protein